MEIFQSEENEETKEENEQDNTNNQSDEEQEKEDENHKYSRKSLHDGIKWPLTNLSIIKDLIKQDKIILLNPFEYDNLEGEDS